MGRTKTTVKLTAGSATALVAANGSRTQLRLTNTTANTTVYVAQNSSITTATGGNQVLKPNDCLEVEGAAAAAAWYGITDSVVPTAPTVVTDELDPR